MLKSYFIKTFILFTCFFSSLAFAQLEFSPVPSSGEIPAVAGSQYIYITNKGSTAVNLNLSVSQAGVSIASNRCTSALSYNKSCYIILSVANASMPSGSTVFSILNGSSPILNLRYSKSAPVEFSEFTSSSASLSDFSQQIAYIKNSTLSSKSYSPTFSGPDASKFEIVLNRCSGVLPGSSCAITYKLKPQSAGSFSASLTESQSNGAVAISATIAGAAPGTVQPTVKSLSLSTNSLDFGTLIRFGLSSPLVINITNTGNTTISPIVEFSQSMGLVLNRCSSILAGETCSLSVGINPDSSMSNGPILGQSVTIKADASDSPHVVSASAILNIGTGCSSAQHYEGNSCVANVRSCSITNGVGSQTYSSGSWGSCQVVSCNASYYQSGQSCNLITYTASYSAYAPAIPTLNACDGTVVSSRSISSCIRNDNNQSVAVGNCSDPTPIITTSSPAGQKTVSISHGSEIKSCAAGSQTQTFVSRTCDSGYHNDGSGCSVTTYVASYSAYSPAVPSNLQACDGSVVSNRTITQCLQAHDNAPVATSFCSDPTPSISTQSPAGNGNQTSVPNGQRFENCPIGQSTGTYVYQCNSGYQLTGSDCTQIITFTETSYAEASSGAKRVIDNGYIIHNVLGNDLSRPASSNGYIIWQGEYK